MTRILIVEDSPTQAEQLSQILQSEGYEVEVARDGQEGLERVHKFSFDLIVSDILMPRLSGYDFCRRVKADAHSRSIPVVLLTSLRDPMDIIEGLECGADNFVTKPYDAEYLLARIGNILQNRRLRDQGKLKIGVDILFLGKKLTITSEKEQILDLLVSTFEDVVRANQELKSRRDELAVAGRQFQVLYRIAQTLNSAETVGDIAGQVLDLTRELPGVDAGWISLCDSQGNFRLGATQGLPPALQKPGALEGDCQCRRNLLSGELRASSDILECERLQKASGDTGGLSHHVSIPLGSGNKKFGVMNLAGKKELFTEDELKLLQGVGEQIGIAIERTFLREQLETQLHISQEKYRTLMENANDGILIMDAEGKILEVNARAEEILGRDRERIVGREYLDFLSSSEIDVVQKAFRRLPSKEGIQLNDVHLRRPDDERVCADISASSVAVDDTSLVFGIVRDVTERNLLARQFYQAQKMEAIGRLSGGVAHDFNNLLTAITGFADFVLDSLGPENPLSQDVNEIKKAGERAAALTRQLLAFSRIHPMELQPVNLNSLVEDGEKLLRRLMGEDVELVTMLDPGLGPIHGDFGQLEQVLMNLAVNSRDAMPEGGRLTIETATVSVDELYGRQHFNVPPGQYVQLSVSDTGSGMSEEVQSKIFEPFFTTKEAAKGTGLGLSTVYGIVRRHEGHIWVYSEEGKGTTFKIYIPLAALEEIEAEAERSVARPPLPRGSEYILLVEDDETVRSLLLRILQEEGYKVFCAGTPEEAKACFVEHGDQIELLLTDVVLPAGDGPQLYEDLAKEKPSLRVLFMSGYSGDPLSRFDLKKRRVELLEKPFTRNTVAKRVRDVLDMSKPPDGRKQGH